MNQRGKEAKAHGALGLQLLSPLKVRQKSQINLLISADTKHVHIPRLCCFISLLKSSFKICAMFLGLDLTNYSILIRKLCSMIVSHSGEEEWRVPYPALLSFPSVYSSQLKGADTIQKGAVGCIEHMWTLTNIGS